MRRHILVLILIALSLARPPHGFGAAPAAQAPAARRSAASVEIDALDRKADPCVDFYQFACGGWVGTHPLPPDRRSYGRFAEVQEHNFTILRGILDPSTISASSRPSSREGAASLEGDRKKAADYYASCMDEAAIEAAGLAPMRQDLATIDELVNPDDLPVLVAHLHAIGVRALFRFGAQTDVLGDATQQIADLDQGGLSLPDREYCLKSDQRSLELRAKFVAAVQTMMMLAG